MKFAVPSAIVSVALGTSACLFGENVDDNAFARPGDAGAGAVAPGNNPTSPVAPNADGTCTDGQTAANGACVAPKQDTDTAEHDTWKTVASMPTARERLAAVVGADGRIFAIGGESGVGRLNVVEAYTPSTDSWTTLKRMPTARDGLAASLGADGRLFVVGGLGPNNEVFGTVEAYTPNTNSWATGASMPTARYDLAMVRGADGRLFALGGDNDVFGGPTATVEAYTPSTNSWATVASMPTARDGLAAVTAPDGHIFAIGGHHSICDDYCELATVERYTP